MDCSTPGYSSLLFPRLCSSSCPLSWWCYLTIASSSIPFSFCLQSLLEHQGLFQWVSSSHQVVNIIGASALASDLPMNIQGWIPLGLTGLTLQFKGHSRVFSSAKIWKYQFFGAQLYLWSSSHIHNWLLGKPQLWQYEPLSEKWCFCFFIVVTKIVMAFLPGSRHLLISWLRSPSQWFWSLGK